MILPTGRHDIQASKEKKKPERSDLTTTIGENIRQNRIQMESIHPQQHQHQHQHDNQQPQNQSHSLAPDHHDHQQYEELALPRPLPRSFPTHQPHFRPPPARPRPSLLKGIAYILLPVIFSIHFLTTGTVILVYVLALKEPLPRRYVFGAAVAFGVIIGLLGVCNGLVVLRRRFCGKDEVKGGGNGDKEKGSPTSSRSGEEINGCCCCVRVGRRVGRWLVEYEEKSHKFRVWKERRARKKLGSESTYEVCDDEMKDGALFKKSFDEGAGDMMRSSVVTTRIGGAIERVEQGQPRLSFEVEGTDVGCRSRECLQSDIGATQQGIWGSGYISPRTDFYKQAGAVRASRFDQALAVSSPDTLRTQSPPSNRPTIASQNIAAAQQQRPFSGPTSMAHEDRLPHFPSPMASSREASANEQDAVSNNLKLAEGAAVQNSSLSNPLVTTPMSRMKVPNRTSSRKRVPEPHRPPEGKQQYQAPNPPPTTALPIMLSHQVKARHSQASSSAQSVSSPPATTPLPATPTPQPHYSNSTNTRPTHSLKRTSVSSETLGRGGYLLPSSTYHRQEEPRTPTSPRSKQDGPFSYFAPNDSRTPINVNHNPAFQQQQQQQTQDQRQNRILRHARHGRAKSSHGVHRNASISEVEEPPPSLSRSAPLSSPSVPAGSYEAQGYNTYFPDSAVQARAGTKRMAFKNTHIRNLSSTALSSSPDKLQVLEGVQGIGSWQRKDCATTIAVAVGETEMEDVEARVEVVWRLEGELAEMPPLCEMRIGMDRDTRSSLGEEERDQERSEDGEEKEQEKEDVEDVVERAAPENESSDSPLRFGFGCGIESLLGMVEERRMVEENPNLGPDSPEDLEISLSYGAGLKFLEGSIGVE